MTSIPEVVDEIAVVHGTVWSVHVMHIFGELDLSNAAALAREIDSAAHSPRVLVDLSNCTFLDGTAMRVLLSALKSRTGLRIVAPAGSAPERAVRIARLSRTLPLFSSFASALQW